MPCTKAFAINAGSAEIDAMVARVAPAILELLADGSRGPRPPSSRRWQAGTTSRTWCTP
jgi:hypothetical protein